MNEIRKYREDHQKIKVYCPVCGKIMAGWTETRDWTAIWIAHVTPNKKGKECWATHEQMEPIRREWDKKYVYEEAE